MKGSRTGRAARLWAAALAAAILLTACSADVPCESCGRTPTKGYRNDASGEKMHYCGDCSAECAFCPNDATTYYTSALGIMFVCGDCFEYIERISGND